MSLYLWLGQPATPSVPISSRGAEFARMAEMRDMTNQLRLRMAESPEDPRGWELLARAESELGDWEGAAQAYREAVARSPVASAELQSALGEAITAAAGGTVSPEAKAAFDQALLADPEDPRARYYQGLWLQQAGRVRDVYTVCRAPPVPRRRHRHRRRAAARRLGASRLRPPPPPTTATAPWPAERSLRPGCRVR